jgi:hypothetical protein
MIKKIIKKSLFNRFGSKSLKNHLWVLRFLKDYNNSFFSKYYVLNKYFYTNFLFLNNFVLSDLVFLIRVINNKSIENVLGINQEKRFVLTYFNEIYEGRFNNAFRYLDKIIKKGDYNNLHVKIIIDAFSNFDLPNLVQNKTLSFIGPAKTELHREEIEVLSESEILVTVNLKNSNVFLREIEALGVRNIHDKTIISYWNNEQKNYRIENNLEFDNIVVHVFKHINIKDSKNFDTSLKFLAVSSWPELGLNKRANMLQILLTDLLNMGIKQIFVFNVDLMLTVHRKKGYYPGEWKREGDRTQQIRQTEFINHDPAEQFLILQQFSNDKRLIFNKPLRNVLNNGLKEYYNSLQSIYGE